MDKFVKEMLILTIVLIRYGGHIKLTIQVLLTKGNKPALNLSQTILVDKVDKGVNDEKGGANMA